MKEVVYQDQISLITPDIIKKFHLLVGKNLGSHFNAIPGKFRTDRRIVGPYRCPDYQDINSLIKKYCDWLLQEFHYDKGQEFHEIVIQAIVTHVYLEWIHPFGDGNGRTGRLLEFYLLLRSGTPDIASHILSNHYNKTRSEYYRQLDLARKTKDLTDFIEYAILGLRDGLHETLKIIQNSQFHITWQKLIYDRFAEKKYRKKNVFKRQRSLILSLLPQTKKKFTLQEISMITPEIAKYYADVSERTIKRDLDELIEMELLKKINNYYIPNIELLKYILHNKKIRCLKGAVSCYMS